MLDYIDPKIISNSILMYFCEKEISIPKLSHMELSDTCLKKLSIYSEEAYFTLTKRLFYDQNYSIEEYISLMQDCHFESVFFNIFLSEKIISFKGLIIHDIISNNDYLSDEFKALSQKIRYAKHLYCTNNEEEIIDAYEKNDYIYMMAISQNTVTPCYILENLSEIKGVKYAHKIRKSSMQILSIKNML